jgi:hypothetical protein
MLKFLISIILPPTLHGIPRAFAICVLARKIKNGEMSFSSLWSLCTFQTLFPGRDIVEMAHGTVEMMKPLNAYRDSY